MLSLTTPGRPFTVISPAVVNVAVNITRFSIVSIFATMVSLLPDLILPPCTIAKLYDAADEQTASTIKRVPLEGRVHQRGRISVRVHRPLHFRPMQDPVTRLKKLIRDIPDF